ncbi:uncharacterized protein sertad3.L [Xenopus laevis]|uniref:SERTA domain-containing protein n=2 Tax=Xenopus laevis TaxID=8355 RepID=A0A974H7U3_XENLA|nr:uncharacterized protein sertad3.L [Xenopus laevis]OCT68013.1 hypothetical protein XELAEV_18039309mg [Xenopus laevis]
MPTRGIKRKLPEWEDIGMDGFLAFRPDSYPYVRQSLLNLSLEKFNKGRMMVEPSLRRYVLIANTLHIIQDEIRRENNYTSPVAEAGVNGAYDQALGDAVGVNATMENRFPLLAEELDNILPTMDDDFSVSAAIANILKELENVLDEGCPQNLQRLSLSQNLESKIAFGNSICPQNAQHQSSSIETVKDVLGREATLNSSSGCKEENKEIELITELVLSAACSETLQELPVAMDTSMLETASSKDLSNSSLVAAPVPMDTLVSKDMPTHSENMQQNSSETPLQCLKPKESVFGSFEIMSSSYLNDVSFDDPFSDIDTSVFEKEMPAIVGSSSRLSASEDCWFPSACNSPSFNSNQGIRDCNDLDNIIEILVGS